MECNKDEAVRAMEIAEKKFLAKDIVGARKFALKAQNLYPGLEGISQMIAILDVYVSAEKKVNGEADWYAILGVHPKADDETMRKQYRKLALMLHPDKNKSIGADGAFKRISEAWSVLSDKTKRLAYDQKRNSNKVFQKVSSTTGGSSTASGPNNSYNFTKSNVKARKNTSQSGHSSAPVSSKKAKQTFWTACHGCKMQYEYLIAYLNHNLLCPNCHEPFLAVETGPPATDGTKSPTSWNFSQQGPNSQAASKSTLNSRRNSMVSPNGGPDSHKQTNFQWGPFSRTGGASAHAASVVQHAYEKVKREREETQAATKREAFKQKNHISKKMAGVPSSGQSNARKKKRGMEDVSLGSNGRNITTQMAAGSGGAGPVNLSGYRQAHFESGRVNGTTKSSNSREVPQFETQTLLMEKAKKEIHKIINKWSSAKVVKFERTGTEKTNDIKEDSLLNHGMHDQNKSAKLLDMDNGVQGIKSPLSTSNARIDAETLETMLINVPDPDFHDFDKDRTERCFEENQVWAVYDDDDGMPRYYAMIHNVISLDPFKMRISWLNSKTNSELGPLNWVGFGFSKICGDFRVGRYEIYDSLNAFSHKVRYTKGARGVIRIHPRKGDVWALYRNWSPDWNELTADDVIHKYDMVEVIEDYNEEQGVIVMPLVKVAGFKTLFHHHLDPREVRSIPKHEMFRFSHQIPSYLLSGLEGPNAPKGCRELDPAATPSELLQVIIDVKEEETIDNEEKSEDKVADDVEKVNEKNQVEEQNDKDSEQVEMTADGKI